MYWSCVAAMWRFICGAQAAARGAAEEGGQVWTSLNDLLLPSVVLSLYGFKTELTWDR